MDIVLDLVMIQDVNSVTLISPFAKFVLLHSL